MPVPVLDIALPMVVLRHDTPNGGFHYDWLLATRRENKDPDARTLLSFRCDAVPGNALILECEPMLDHRARYLEFEGDIGGDRGEVTRIASGEWVCLAWEEGAMALECAHGGGRCQAEGRVNRKGNRWIFRFSPIPVAESEP